MMKSTLLTILFCFSGVCSAQVGMASWYGPGFHGKKTASGQVFNTHKYTAAHKHLKFGTKVKVTNLTNNKIVFVTITDRGPYIRNRIIDLSKAAKTAIGMVGTTKVSVEIIN